MIVHIPIITSVLQKMMAACSVLGSIKIFDTYLFPYLIIKTKPQFKEKEILLPKYAGNFEPISQVYAFKCFFHLNEPQKFLLKCRIT